LILLGVPPLGGYNYITSRRAGLSATAGLSCFLNCSSQLYSDYFDSAIGNCMLSVHYQIGGGNLQKLTGNGEVRLISMCKLNIFMLANCCIKKD